MAKELTMRQLLQKDIIENVNALGIFQYEVEVCGVCLATTHTSNRCPQLYDDGLENALSTGGFHGQQQSRYCNNFDNQEPHQSQYSQPSHRFQQEQFQQMPLFVPNQTTPSNSGMSLEDMMRALASNNLHFQQRVDACIQSLSTQVTQLVTVVNRLKNQFDKPVGVCKDREKVIVEKETEFEDLEVVKIEEVEEGIGPYFYRNCEESTESKTEIESEVTTREHEEIEKEIEAFLNADWDESKLAIGSEEIFDLEATILEMEELHGMGEKTSQTDVVNDETVKEEAPTNIHTPLMKPPCLELIRSSERLEHTYPQGGTSSTVTSSIATTSPHIINGNKENLQRILDADPFWVNSAPISNSSRIITSSYVSTVINSSLVIQSPHIIASSDSPTVGKGNLQWILKTDSFSVNSVLVALKCGNAHTQDTSSSPATPLSHSFNENLLKVLKTGPFLINPIRTDPKYGKNMFITDNEYVFDPGGRKRMLGDVRQSAKKIVRVDDGSWRGFKEPEVTRPP